MSKNICQSICQGFTMIYLLMWKNLLLRKRHYIVTAGEIILPTLFISLYVHVKVDTKEILKCNVVETSTILVLGFIFIVPATMRGVVSERQTGIKEFMKLSGIPNWMHWLAWMINSMLTQIISGSIVVVLLFYDLYGINKGPVVRYLPFTWWILITLFLLSSVSFLFFISTFFKKPIIAITVGIIFWISTFFGTALSLGQEKIYAELDVNKKMAAALLPNTAFYWATNFMCSFEFRNFISIQYQNISKYIDPELLEIGLFGTGLPNLPSKEFKINQECLKLYQENNVKNIFKYCTRDAPTPVTSRYEEQTTTRPMRPTFPEFIPYGPYVPGSESGPFAPGLPGHYQSEYDSIDANSLAGPNSIFNLFRINDGFISYDQITKPSSYYESQFLAPFTKKINQLKNTIEQINNFKKQHGDILDKIDPLTLNQTTTLNTEGDDLKFENIIFMFLFNTVLYLILTMYFEAILPSQHGIRKPWHFIFKPLSPWYWIKRKGQLYSENIEIDARQGRGAFETEPIGQNVGVEIRNMKRNFGRNKKAVQGVSLKMYEGEIFALLGHNGAGKTTTISCCIGMIPPSSGTAIINGYDIRKDLEQVRKNLGLCPQHNLIFEELTVSEHLRFFARMKGLSSKAARADCNDILMKLQLNDKSNKLAKNLSGGQKRKLCLGISLIGGAKVVFLDEPTSGMDVEARRAIWELLLRERAHRTIILTTHFMEEADVLGDRIGIMAEGKVQCCGTSSFLKKFYGAGYTLSLATMDPRSTVDVLKLVKTRLPTAEMKVAPSNNSPCEWSISIPSESCSTSSYPAMFRDLRENMARLGILNVGLSLTTMDEVFIKVGELLDNLEKNESNVNFNFTRISNELKNPVVKKDSTYSGYSGIYNIDAEADKEIPEETPVELPIIPDETPVQLPIIPDVTTQDVVEKAENTIKPIILTLIPKPSSTFTTYTKYEAEEEDKPKPVIHRGRKGIKLVCQQFSGLIIKRISYTLKKLNLFIPQMCMPILLVFASILIANYILPDETVSEPEEYRIHPDEKLPILTGIFGAFVPTGLALLAACFIVAPLEEKLCNGKQLQLMTGVSPIVYWGSAFAWDYFIMMILNVVMVSCFLIFQNHEAFTSYGGAGVFFLIIVIYGFAVIPFSYLWTLPVNTVPGGFSIVVILHVGSGLLIPTIVIIFERYPFLDRTMITIRTINRLFPTYGASMSIMRLIQISIQNSRCNFIPKYMSHILCNPLLSKNRNIISEKDKKAINFDRGCCSTCDVLKTSKNNIICFEPDPYLSWNYKDEISYTTDDGESGRHQLPGIGQELLYMVLMGVCYHFLLLLIEFGLIQRFIGWIFKRKPTAFQNTPHDPDVLMEAERINQLVMRGQINQDALVISRFCKSYESFAAVSNLSFGVHHGECFGLLGVNGAGKTTTFRMLTGDERRSSGNAHAMNCSLDSHKKRFLSHLGYCPQFDGIIDVLSGYEMIALFGRLRGVKSVAAETKKWLHRVGLTEAAHSACKNYSGGMKRRLSTAMAMIGDPEVVLLDEPTSGVDPISRRQFWKIISLIKESGRAIILTSHSMDEIEACCTRVGIMVNGQMQCLGSVQYLKNKFAQGYALAIKLKPNIPKESVEEFPFLEQEIMTAFDPCTIKDIHKTSWQFHIHDASFPWDILFQTMEDISVKFPHIIEEYSITETTLEEVFLSFARAQYPPRKWGGGCCGL